MVGLDMSGTWSATAASYFTRVPKTRVLEAVTEAVNVEEAGRIAGFKKVDMAEAAERLVEGNGWLPPVLRTVALLALPMVQAESARLDRMEADLVAVSKHLTDTHNEDSMLDEISRLGAEVADLTAATAFRLGAMKAYAGIVSDRLRDLACTPIEGYQPFDDFIDRRLTPATRTCLAFAERLEALATRLERATALLRTRIELRGQAQNTALLASVERTGARQLKLQHLVEGLSVVAVSYYALGMIQGFRHLSTPLPNLPLNH